MQMLRMLDIDALDVPEQIPHGDMPGDGVTIGQDNIERAKTVLSAIQGTLERRLEESAGGRVAYAAAADRERRSWPPFWATRSTGRGSAHTS